VLAESPLKPAECDVTIDPFNGVLEPYAVVVPYSTCVSLASLVVHETVAELDVAPELATALMTGGVVSGAAVVVKVKSPEVARFPAGSRDFTR
jgi:hypothetical protein